MVRKSEKGKGKYRHITVRRLYEMKDVYIEQRAREGKSGAVPIGSKWVGDFIKFVVANKNQHENA